MKAGSVSLGAEPPQALRVISATQVAAQVTNRLGRVLRVGLSTMRSGAAVTSVLCVGTAES